MRINDIMDEGQVSNWMDPATFDMLAKTRQYNKELDAIKAKDAPPPAEKKPTDVIRVDYIPIPTEWVRHWVETHDKEHALDKAVNWGASRLPLELKQEMRQDPEWQKIILQIWEIAEYYLRARGMGPGNRAYARGYTRLDRLMADTEFPLKLVRKLFYLIARYRRKYKVDKYGNRLPDHELARRQPGDEPGKDIF